MLKEKQGQARIYRAAILGEPLLNPRLGRSKHHLFGHIVSTSHRLYLQLAQPHFCFSSAPPLVAEPFSSLSPPPPTSPRRPMHSVGRRGGPRGRLRAVAGRLGRRAQAGRPARRETRSMAFGRHARVCVSLVFKLFFFFVVVQRET